MGEGNPLLIENPEQNLTRFGAFFLEDEEWINILQENLTLRKITPTSHPRALELFAGRGPIVATLAQWGWSNLTCIDRAVSPDPIAPPFNVMVLSGFIRND